MVEELGGLSNINVTGHVDGMVCFEGVESRKSWIEVWCEISEISKRR